MGFALGRRKGRDLSLYSFFIQGVTRNRRKLQSVLVIDICETSSAAAVFYRNSKGSFIFCFVKRKYIFVCQVIFSCLCRKTNSYKYVLSGDITGKKWGLNLEYTNAISARDGKLRGQCILYMWVSDFFFLLFFSPLRDFPKQ